MARGGTRFKQTNPIVDTVLKLLSGLQSSEGSTKQETSSKDSFFNKALTTLTEGYEGIDDNRVIMQKLKRLRARQKQYKDVMPPGMYVRFEMEAGNLQDKILENNLNKDAETIKQHASRRKNNLINTIDFIAGKDGSKFKGLISTDSTKLIKERLDELKPEIDLAGFEEQDYYNNMYRDLEYNDQKITHFNVNKESLNKMKKAIIEKIDNFDKVQFDYGTKENNQLWTEINEDFKDYVNLYDVIANQHSGRASKDETLKGDIKAMNASADLFYNILMQGDKRMDSFEKEGMLNAIHLGDAKYAKDVSQSSKGLLGATYQEQKELQKDILEKEVLFEENYPFNPNDYIGNPEGLIKALEDNKSLGIWETEAEDDGISIQEAYGNAYFEEYAPIEKLKQERRRLNTIYSENNRGMGFLTEDEEQPDFPSPESVDNVKSKIPEIINDVIGRADLFDKPHIKRTFNKINTTNVKEIQEIVLRDIENAKNEKEKKEIKKGYNDFLRMIDEVIKSDPNVNKNLKNYSKFYNNAIYKID